MKPAAVIFDIDGTIADTSDRIHLIKPKDGQKKNWGKFFKESINDNKFTHTWLIYQALKNTGVHIFFVTARPENNRDMTFKWLDKNGFNKFHGLFMRPDKEFKPDDEIKKDIYNEHFKDHYDVVAVFEDRLHVAAMWRKQGIPVFLCGDDWLNGDWD